MAFKLNYSQIFTKVPVAQKYVPMPSAEFGWR